MVGLPRETALAICESDAPLSAESVVQQRAADARDIRAYMREQLHTSRTMADELDMMRQLALPKRTCPFRIDAKRLDAWLASFEDDAAVADSQVHDEICIVVRTFRQKQQTDPYTWYICDAGECCPFESLDVKRVERHQRRCLYCLNKQQSNA